MFMRVGYPPASTESSQKGLWRRAQKAAAATGCPLDFPQAAQFEFPPPRGAQQGKEAGEAMGPLTGPRAAAQQHLGHPFYRREGPIRVGRRDEILVFYCDEHPQFLHGQEHAGSEIGAPISRVELGAINNFRDLPFNSFKLSA